jgi:hypothetical protein
MSREQRLRIEEEERARDERIERLSEALRESMRRTRAIFDELRERGILPPEEPRRRV